MADKKKLPVYAIKTEDGIHTLYRNDEHMQTPRALPLAVPQEKLAQAILHECLAQKEERLDLRTMPMTQMTLTVIDIASTQRSAIINGIVRYGETELVCQRAADPVDLIEKQHAVWQPYLDWCKASFKADLLTGSGIVPFEQNIDALAALRAAVEVYDDYKLIGLSEAAGISGSLVLGLALVTGHATAKLVFEAAELDTLWQKAKWGEDPATAARHLSIQRDLDDCVRWFSLV